LNRRLPDPGHPLLDNGQHLTAPTEFLERGEMGQLLGQSQPLPQGGVDGQHFQHTAASALQIRAQHQAGQELALGEVVPAADCAVIGQIPLAQTHRQFCHSLHDR